MVKSPMFDAQIASFDVGSFPGAGASLQAPAPVCSAGDMTQGQPWVVCLIYCFNMSTYPSVNMVKPT